MADATQVKRRRGTASQCEAMTPAEAEIIVDLTNDTTRVGDGVRAGGFIQPNFSQIQTQQFVYAVAGGTANAITVSLNPPLIGYVGGTSLEFRASNTNTGAATLNVNGLGAKNIYKLSGGSLVAISSGDIVSGVVYRATYDGTQFQLTNAEFSSPDPTPTGGLIKIGTYNLSSGSVQITLPDGYYSYRFEVTQLSGAVGQLSVFNGTSGAGETQIASFQANRNGFIEIIKDQNFINAWGRSVNSNTDISVSMNRNSDIIWFYGGTTSVATIVLYGRN